MSNQATVVKVNLEIADMDRNYYQGHRHTLARHTSESDQRFMARILAFALNASDSLAFASNNGAEDGEAELAEKDLIGDMRLWVSFGTPDEKRLRKASKQSRQVQLFAHGSDNVPSWWQQNKNALVRFQNLKIWQLSDSEITATAPFISRNMKLRCNISDGQLWLSNDAHSVTLAPRVLKDYAA